MALMVVRELSNKRHTVYDKMTPVCPISISDVGNLFRTSDIHYKHQTSLALAPALALPQSLSTSDTYIYVEKTFKNVNN